MGPDAAVMARGHWSNSLWSPARACTGSGDTEAVRTSARAFHRLRLPLEPVPHTRDFHRSPGGPGAIRSAVHGSRSGVGLQSQGVAHARQDVLRTGAESPGGGGEVTGQSAESLGIMRIGSLRERCHPGTRTTTSTDQTSNLQLTVGAGHGARRQIEVGGELAHRRQALALGQPSGANQPGQPGTDLLETAVPG